MAKKIATPGKVGSRQESATFYIKITKSGPYLVYGNPPINQEVIISNEDGSPWVYRKGNSYDNSGSPVALCRCGASTSKPFCDGAHRHAVWDGTETSSRKSFVEDSEEMDGVSLVLTDNEKYCAFARFCDAYGRIWNLVKMAQTEDEKELVRREAAHCPSGRLIVWDRETGKAYEPRFSPAISVLEDPGIKVSGPLWIKGGIRIESADGTSYEIRNRVTLCRCGQSSNKPFCDGTHASIGFDDHLPIDLKEDEW